MLSARDAAAALAGGFRTAGVDAVELPLADGGEGTADVLHDALDGEWRSANVVDPLGRPIHARYLLLADGRAVVESAEAIGLGRLEPAERDPTRATSRGLGELIEAAVADGASELIVALGGSATVDGGAGMRAVLRELPVPTVAATDIRNPLLGPRGAARAFGPQKGATPEQVAQLEARIAAMEELAPFADLPGAGSAGGLGAAFAALGAELVPGIDLVLRELDFRLALEGALLAVTGEGEVDSSSVEGKVPAGVSAACRQARVACVVFGGRVWAGSADPLYELGASAVFPLSGRPENAQTDLRDLGESLGRLVLALRSAL